uniref:radical SAM protein n=1 Tax=uncultured Desulfovibrio sp. TaxID=167968 RepID=UPI00345CC105
MPGTSPSASASSWLDPVALETALARESAPETAVVREILDKSLALEPLGPDEIVALLRVRKPEDMKLIFGTADLVKQKVYGDRIVLTAPLHISNTCASECRYCASRKGNTAIQRKRLDQAELREAARKLIRQGHKRVVLVSGQSTSADVEYWAEAVDALHRLFDGMGEIRRVNLDLGVLTAEEYALLRRTEAGTVNIYQETYHEASYRNAHP